MPNKVDSKKKLNNLPRFYEERLSNAKEETLDRIAEDIFDIEDIKDLDKYLH